MRNETVHVFGHAVLLALSLVALLAITQACSGSTEDSGFDGNSALSGSGSSGSYGYGDDGYGYGDYGDDDYGDYGYGDYGGG